MYWEIIVEHMCVERYNFELFNQGFLSSVKRVIVAFKVSDLGIFVCTRAVVSYMGILSS